MQTTIHRPVSCYGITVHSGDVVQLTMRPAAADTGVIFVRTDVKSIDNVIPATYLNVSDTKLSTLVSNNAGVHVSTIEHLMAAIWSCGIHNVVIELDGPEVPIMDGSSKPFVFLLECAGKRNLNVPARAIKLLKEVAVVEQNCTVIATPYDGFSIHTAIDFPNTVIGKQSFDFSDRKLFRDEISPARTFGFLKELNYLQSLGLAKGASIKNAVGVDETGVINPEGLRFEDEFARHKLLDAIGDFFTGGNIIGSFSCDKTGHHHNNLLLRAIFENPANYSVVEL